MRTISIDPSLTATGVIDMEVTKVAALDVRVDVNWSATIRTKSTAPLADRLGFLVSELMAMLATACHHSESKLLVIENTTDFCSIPGRRRKQRDIAITGAAFGAACAAVVQFGHPVLYGTRVWIPMTRGSRGLRHFVNHKRLREYIRERWKLHDLTDDEVFAAGVGVYAAWIELAPDNPLTIWGNSR